MEVTDVPVPIFNSSNDPSSYVPYSTMKTISRVSEKFSLILFAIALVLTIIQTFWKNKSIDRLLAYMIEVYSDGKLKATIVGYRQQTFTCYQFGQRFSHIPYPKRLILFIICTHIQILLLIAVRTVFIRKTEPITDCNIFYHPYELLQCEENRDPCRLNNTESAPKCTYYYFELSNCISMVTSIVTWHYALRYFIVQLIRSIQWMLFRADDQPRKCCCCCQMRATILRCLMYFCYILLLVYFICTIITGFWWDRSAFYDLLPTEWGPLTVTMERLCGLFLATIPELLQNWLETTSDGKILQVFYFQGQLLNNVEPVTYLINNKETSSSITENQPSQIRNTY